MDFDQLFKYCQDLSNSNSEKCLVCHIPIEQEDTYIKLKCLHIFHPECVNYKEGIFNCLYCETKSIPDKINWKTNTILKVNEIACIIIIKSGSKKGLFCNRINCLYHKINSPRIQVLKPSMIQVLNPKSNNLTKTNKSNTSNTSNKCIHIIKYGINSGQICGRDLPCNYHKINLINNNDEDSIVV